MVAKRKVKAVVELAKDLQAIRHGVGIRLMRVVGGEAFTEMILTTPFKGCSRHLAAMLRIDATEAEDMLAPLFKPDELSRRLQMKPSPTKAKAKKSKADPTEAETDPTEAEA